SRDDFPTPRPGGRRRIAPVAQDRRLLYVLNRAARSAVAHADQRMIDRIGIPVMNLGALSHLASHPGATAAEVGSLFDLTRSEAGGLFARLSHSGLVRRDASGGDRRGAQLYLTEAGERTRRAGRLEFGRIMADIMEGFSRKEQDVVFRFLNVVVERFADDWE